MAMENVMPYEDIIPLEDLKKAQGAVVTNQTAVGQCQTAKE